MNINLKEITFNEVYKLDNIVRYNPLHKLHNETVAAHSFFVIFFVSKVCTELELDDIIKLRSMEAALLHDVPEAIINDITHDVKELIPGLTAMLQPYEEDIVRSYNGQACIDLFNPETTDEKLVQAIVTCGDVFSVFQYCINEVNLGNKTFEPLLEQTKERMDKCCKDVSKLAAVYKNDMKVKGGNNNANEQ